MAILRYKPVGRSSRTPADQIAAATWPTTAGVVLSVCFILAVCITTNGKDTTSSVWVSNASVLVAAGGIVLKGSFGAIIGMALYHRLWLVLGSHRNVSRIGSKSGLTVAEIESYHLASRLSIGMLFQRSASATWVLGILCLILTSAIVPVLQYGVDVVARPTITPTTIELEHAQLDSRMATGSGAAGYPDNVAPNVLRAATVALFGADTSFVYTRENVTGNAEFADVQYADVDCTIDVSRGQVATNKESRYYDFTEDWITTDDGDSYNFYRGLKFRSTLNNGSDFLHHECQIRPAFGTCSTRLNQGAGLMRDLKCERTAWLTEFQLPDTLDSPAIGFFAVAVAFFLLFQGEAWTSQQLRPQQNSTFVAATARYYDRSTIGMPKDLVSHVQRTLWHTAINAKPVSLPEAEVGGRYDLNSTAAMVIQDEKSVLVVNVDYAVIAVVLGTTLVITIAALMYLVLADNRIPGRLMRDSLVHTLSVGARPSYATGIGTPIHLRQGCTPSLEHVLKETGNLRLRCSLTNDFNVPGQSGQLIIERVGSESIAMLTQSARLRLTNFEPILHSKASSRPILSSTHESY
ncbi:hypothetical protein H2200_007710 [Cladophialophora chaetospira]|uniref:Uncharacterized protein n=1 Tax=Cladophialophora chaetospira TaxID=386627 RepID=A0AA39CGQ7_9EURO|nr:hypothetical protein H2200_007710 [Cladophialophora chaetospira]